MILRRSFLRKISRGDSEHSARNLIEKLNNLGFHIGSSPCHELLIVYSYFVRYCRQNSHVYDEMSTALPRMNFFGERRRHSHISVVFFFKITQNLVSNRGRDKCFCNFFMNVFVTFFIGISPWFRPFWSTLLFQSQSPFPSLPCSLLPTAPPSLKCHDPWCLNHVS